MSQYSKLIGGTNGLTRRNALKGMGAVGAAAMMSSMPAFNRAFAQTPNKGGHFRSASNAASATDNLDPTTYLGQFLYYAGYYWGNALVRLDSKMNLVPELAESWDMRSDAKIWVFKLRQGVEFHNGKSFTAEDVVWTINRHRAKEAASGLKEVFAQIVDIKATGPHEVTFELQDTNPDWPYTFTDYHLQMQPKDGPTDKGIGTGAYMYENFDPGVRLLLKRNPNYWRDGFAHFDSVEHLAINDPTARVSALQTGQVDFITAVEPKIAGFLETAGFDIHRVDSTWYNAFAIHMDAAPFDNNDLRLALKYAIDRKETIDKVMYGAGQIGNDNPVPSFFRFFNSELPQKQYDLDKAKFHYQKSGHSGKLPSLLVSNIAFPGAVESAELFQQQAARAGIAFDVERMPDDGFWSNIWDQKPFFATTSAGRATEDILLSQQFISTAAWNEVNWNREDVDQLLNSARKEVDEAKRRQMYWDVQEIVSMDGGLIVPQFQQLLFGSSKKLQGFETSPFGDGKFIDTMYFAA